MNIIRITRLSPLLKHSKISWRSLCVGFSDSNLQLENISNNNRLLLTRHVSTYEVKNETRDESLLRRVIKKVPFFNVNKSRIRAAAYIHYEGIADNVKYIDFFEKYDLPDTFYSWFVITELHIWLLTIRAMAEGDEGRHFRNCIVEALWADVAQRVKKLGAGNPTEMRMQVAELSEQLQAALIAYDEGLQSDDSVLAGALWRRFYQQRFVDPEHIESLVKYVRKQVTLTDNISRDQLFDTKSINWLEVK